MIVGVTETAIGALGLIEAVVAMPVEGSNVVIVADANGVPSDTLAAIGATASGCETAPPFPLCWYHTLTGFHSASV